MIKKINIIILLICFSIASYSQNKFKEGYIITLQNDTVWGVIDLKKENKNAVICFYKTSADDNNIVEYKPGDINAFRIDANRMFYVSKNITINNQSQLVFTQFLVEGMMDLYYYRDKKLDYYFFEDEDLNVTEISTKLDYFESIKIKRDRDYINKLNYVFRKQPELGKYIRGENVKGEQLKDDDKIIHLNRTNMIMLTQEYHKRACTTGEECSVFEYDYAKYYPNFKLKPYVGMQYFSYAWTDPELSDNKYLYPTIGLQASVSIPAITPSLSLLIDGALSRIASRDEKSQDNGYYAHYDFSSLITQWKVGLEYKYIKSQIQPFVQGGVASAFLFSTSKDFYTTLPHTNGTTSQYTEWKYDPASTFVGWYAALGIDYKLQNEKSIFLQLSYEQLNPKGRVEKNKFEELSSSQLKIGYIF